MAPWCSGYHYYTTSFNKAWTQWNIRNSRWWGSLTMVQAENKAKHLSLISHITKTIHHHHHHQHQSNNNLTGLTWIISSSKVSYLHQVTNFRKSFCSNRKFVEKAEWFPLPACTNIQESILLDTCCPWNTRFSLFEGDMLLRRSA